jgi:hypothetical protein
MSEKIIFQGHVYQDETEMPTSVREQYRRVQAFFTDADQNGTPDFIQNNPLQGLKDLVKFSRTISQASSQGGSFSPEQFYTIQIRDTHIVLNGRAFASPADMPPDVRSSFERLMAQADPTYRPDETWIDPPAEIPALQDDALIPDSLDSPPSTPSVIQEVNSNTSLILLVALASILVCGVGAWFLMRGGL